MEEIFVFAAAAAAIVFEIWSFRRSESALLQVKDELHRNDLQLAEFRYETLMHLKDLERGLAVMQAVQAMNAQMYEETEIVQEANNAQ